MKVTNLYLTEEMIDLKGQPNAVIFLLLSMNIGIRKSIMKIFFIEKVKIFSYMQNVVESNSGQPLGELMYF